MAVLSGIEIDKAKRSYENISVTFELNKLTNKYGTIRPNFFEYFDEKENEWCTWYDEDGRDFDEYFYERDSE